MTIVASGRYGKGRQAGPGCHAALGLACFAILWAQAAAPALASHQGHGSHAEGERHGIVQSEYAVPGASFRVFAERGRVPVDEAADDEAMQAAATTVVDSLAIILERRSRYPRVDEALNKQLLDRVVVEPRVLNQEGKEFPFLVARTKDPGRVKLLISASALKAQGYVGHPDQLAPALAREFQWVVSKADTSPKTKTAVATRDFAHAPVRADVEIGKLSGEERGRILQELFQTYLSTVDDQQSLVQQPLYETGTTTLVPPARPDSTVKFYDILVREALQRIAREPYFQDRTPNAGKALLNGKVWNVAFVKVDQRDWATRTRVAPEDQSVTVGATGRKVQPAKILINAYRTAQPDDPFYQDTNGLPMGALNADQLARVIAAEIEHNIVEKSMTGHVAQDAMTAPK